jgi:hypothetical protein
MRNDQMWVQGMVRQPGVADLVGKSSLQGGLVLAQILELKLANLTQSSDGVSCSLSRHHQLQVVKAHKPDVCSSGKAYQVKPSNPFNPNQAFLPTRHFHFEGRTMTEECFSSRGSIELKTPDSGWRITDMGVFLRLITTDTSL